MKITRKKIPSFLLTIAFCFCMTLATAGVIRPRGCYCSTGSIGVIFTVEAEICICYNADGTTTTTFKLK